MAVRLLENRSPRPLVSSLHFTSWFRDELIGTSFLTQTTHPPILIRTLSTNTTPPSSCSSSSPPLSSSSNETCTSATNSKKEHGGDDDNRRKRWSRRKRKLITFGVIGFSSFIGGSLFTAYWDERIRRRRLEVEKPFIPSPLLPNRSSFLQSAFHLQMENQQQQDSPIRSSLWNITNIICIFSSNVLLKCSASQLPIPRPVRQVCLWMMASIAAIDECSFVSARRLARLRSITPWVQSQASGSPESLSFLRILASISLFEEGREELSRVEWLEFLFNTENINHNSQQDLLLKLFTLRQLLQDHWSPDQPDRALVLVTDFLVLIGKMRQDEQTRAQFAIALHSFLKSVRNGGVGRRGKELISRDPGLNTLEGQVHILAKRSYTPTSVYTLSELLKATTTLCKNVEGGREALLSNKGWLRDFSRLSVATENRLRELTFDIVKCLLGQEKSRNIIDVLEGVEKLLEERAITQSQVVQAGALEEEFDLPDESS